MHTEFEKRFQKWEQ